MTLSDLYQKINSIGSQFTTWSIPLDKDVNLEIKEREGEYYVEVTVFNKD